MQSAGFTLALVRCIVEMVWGLLISAVSKTQVQALLLAQILMTVEVVFSGFAFPVENTALATATRRNSAPIKHWLLILRGILL